ncbi:hypothetical protein MHL30_16960 [Priestia flexa]|uniref:hypothetical protein n=1 Tax=Priestia flexa TaxID=86664 RepID=UPI001EF54B53|nr:hypothetical protein [Priestia flexa]MCG7314811.1 hypothetical protein [Priestia flexa]
MKKIKAVAYYVTKELEFDSIFYHSVFGQIQSQNQQTAGYEKIELTAIFFDLERKDVHDEMPGWEQLISFLTVNKDIGLVLLPKSRQGINFNGADYLLDLSEFISMPPVSSWYIGSEDNAPFHIDEADIPFT